MNDIEKLTLQSGIAHFRDLEKDVILFATFYYDPENDRIGYIVQDEELNESEGCTRYEDIIKKYMEKNPHMVLRAVVPKTELDKCFSMEGDAKLNCLDELFEEYRKD